MVIVVDAIRTAGGMVYSVLTEEILLAHLPEINDCVVVAAEWAGEVCAIALVHLRDCHFNRIAVWRTAVSPFGHSSPHRAGSSSAWGSTGSRPGGKMSSAQVRGTSARNLDDEEKE
jgi:hypothetical protein